MRIFYIFFWIIVLLFNAYFAFNENNEYRWLNIIGVFYALYLIIENAYKLGEGE